MTASQTKLRDYIAQVLLDADNWAQLERRSDRERFADAVVAALSARADRVADPAALLRWAADEIDRETQRLKDDGVLEPDKFRPCRDATADLRRMADEVQAAQPLAVDRDTVERALDLLREGSHVTARLLLESATGPVGEAQQTERVKHSGPETEFCVLCLSGDHERVSDEAQPKENKQS